MTLHHPISYEITPIRILWLHHANFSELWTLIVVIDITSPQSWSIPYRRDIFVIFSATDMECGNEYHIFQINFIPYAITPIFMIKHASLNNALPMSYTYLQFNDMCLNKCWDLIIPHQLPMPSPIDHFGFIFGLLLIIMPQE